MMHKIITLQVLDKWILVSNSDDLSDFTIGTCSVIIAHPENTMMFTVFRG